MIFITLEVLLINVVVQGCMQCNQGLVNPITMKSIFEMPDLLLSPSLLIDETIYFGDDNDDNAVAALKADDSVVACSEAKDQALVDSESLTKLQSSGVVASIPRKDNAVAALKTDGSVVPWSDCSKDGDCSRVQAQTTVDVQSIYSTTSAFAALKADGSVVAWGGARIKQRPFQSL